jgi:uncharacterized protein YyaL (SSP411 family)
VLDDHNKLVTQQETSSLEDGPNHDPKKVLAFLEKWKVEPVDAQAALDAALKQAGEQDKRVFLRFGAPWCGWCHRLDALIARPAVNEALGADFVILKIDTDRMTHGKDVQQKYQTGGGIPWYAILTPDGKVAGTSDIRPGSNIGYPTEPEEVAYLTRLFTGERRHMTEAQAKGFQDELTMAAAEAKASLSRP